MELNKEFWVTVLEEYSKDTKSNFICHYSTTFNRAWIKDEKKIKDIATEFLSNIDDTPFYIGGYTLFNGVYFWGPSFRQIRIDFLNWCIEKS